MNEMWQSSSSVHRCCLDAHDGCRLCARCLVPGKMAILSPPTWLQRVLSIRTTASSNCPIEDSRQFHSSTRAMSNVLALDECLALEEFIDAPQAMHWSSLADPSERCSMHSDVFDLFEIYKPRQCELKPVLSYGLLSTSILPSIWVAWLAVNLLSQTLNVDQQQRKSESRVDLLLVSDSLGVFNAAANMGSYLTDLVLELIEDCSICPKIQAQMLDLDTWAGLNFYPRI